MFSRIKLEKPSVGNRVSVAKNYFDGEDDPYSAYLPAVITKIIGTVVFVYERQIRVKWDLDGTCNDVRIESVMVEPDNTPLQVVQDCEHLANSSKNTEDEMPCQDDASILFVRIIYYLLFIRLFTRFYLHIYIFKKIT